MGAFHSHFCHGSVYTYETSLPDMKPIASSSQNPSPAPRRRSPQVPARGGAQAAVPSRPAPPAPPAPQPAARQSPPIPDQPAQRAVARSVPVVPAWVLLPLRLFLGVTFIYAGLQKLTDPHYFRPGTPTYIGTQITAFAHGTPLQGFLLHVALPHAILFGGLVAYGELAIGMGTLIGLLMRPAAVFGLLLSLTFFLSASWRISPYFYGADIVFVFGWITLLLAGPAAGGIWPVLDARLAQRTLRAAAALNPARRAAVARVLAVALGASTVEAGLSARPSAQPSASVTREQQPMRRAKGSVTVGQRYRGRGSAKVARRDLLRGAALGGGGMLVLVWLRSVLFPSPTPAAPTTSSPGGDVAGSTPAATAPASATGTAATSSNVIGQVGQIAPNSAVSFTIPSNQDPGVLVRTQSGSFVAFDATCTHAGCPVQYDPSSQLLFCPCHGAAFDPAHNAAVVQGPTDTPLASVPISVNNSTGAITLAS